MLLLPRQWRWHTQRSEDSEKVTQQYSLTRGGRAEELPLFNIAHSLRRLLSLG